MPVTIKLKSIEASPAAPATPIATKAASQSALASRPPKLMTIKEAAAFLRISVSTLRRLTKARTLPVYRVGGRLMFELFDLSSFLDQHRIGALH